MHISADANRVANLNQAIMGDVDVAALPDSDRFAETKGPRIAYLDAQACSQPRKAKEIGKPSGDWKKPRQTQ